MSNLPTLKMDKIILPKSLIFLDIRFIDDAIDGVRYIIPDGIEEIIMQVDDNKSLSKI